MNIRRATSSDADALAKVHIDAWRMAYRGLVPDSYLDSLDYARRAERFRESLAADAGETYVAEGDQGMLGFLTLGACRDPELTGEPVGEIWGIYLAPRHWRRGIGRLLCRRGEEMLASRHYTHAVLWVFDGNQAARGFYEAMGYATDGASKVLHPGAPLKAIRYRKQLTSAEPSAPAIGGQTAVPEL
jgi:ribosomal protein S18 acetylase RimI-like enzyme